MNHEQHKEIDHQMMLEGKRLENARQAIRNGARAQREEHTLVDLREHHRAMRRYGARR